MTKIYDTLNDVFVSLTEIELDQDMDWSSYAELGQCRFVDPPTAEEIECMSEDAWLDF